MLYNLDMKRVILVLICALFLPVFSSTYCDSQFAQIMGNAVYLYARPENDNSVKNIICIMENTYYVEILHTENEEFYKVNYNGVSGFVLRKNVKKVDGSPKIPYPSNVTMRTVNNNIYLRSTPVKSNNTLSIIPANCTSLKYIGYVYGEQVDDFRENVWYYVNYLDVYGYVYCEYIDQISTIPQNIEQLSFLNNDYDDVVNPLSNGTCVLIVGVLTAPTLLILLLLYKKPKSKKRFKEQVIVVKEYDDKL